MKADGTAYALVMPWMGKCRGFKVRTFYPVVVATAFLAIVLVCKIKYPPVTIQQKSQHMIIFVDKDGEEAGECTATAIGPHAILTAQHCDRTNVIDTVKLDLSTRPYHLIAAAIDGRDHIIYLLDGPAFTNFLPEDALMGSAPAKTGEPVFIYGDGRGHYPPRRLDGRVDDAGQALDVSDVDLGQQMTWYTMAAIPGDSGSAIYGSDGRVVGLVTYKTARGGSAGFALAFTAGQTHVAHTFSVEAMMAEDQ